MAKIRVYQLAKDLNMDSKDLVEKLKAGGLNVKNYMSTLDGDAAAKAKDIATGVVSEVIEEKRVRPTVIRRRRMTVPVETPKAPEQGEEHIAAHPETQVEEPPPQPELHAQPAPQPESRPEAVQPEPLEDEFDEVEPEGPPEGIEETALPDKAVEPESVTPVEPPPVEAPPITVETQKPEPQTAPKPPVKDKFKKGKKRKMEEPARIIRRAEEGPLSRKIQEEKKEEVIEERPAPVVQSPPALKPVPAPVPPKEDAESERRRREKKRGDKEVTPRGIVRHRKVEVFERADLYEGRLIRRKKKEAAGKEVHRKFRPAEASAPQAAKRKLRVPETVTLSDLAKAMGVKAAELIKKLMSMGVMANMNQPIDFETASLVGEEYGYELELDRFQEESVLSESEDRPEDLSFRPPVVTIMGHVDHGKTSLLDYIRKSNITAAESGGITQHIGAYYVEKEKGDIVFLDTPGHEAFTAMRARGAKVTDLIVLVVAADDGVMPQTREAVNHARAAGIPIIVAVNKIDKANANIDKVRRELAELELTPEEWGGETIFANISAKTGEGVDDLLDLILLQAEMLELKANPNKLARGTVIEAKLDKNRGPVATVLIKKGTLRQGDYFVCGDHFGRVRAMLNHVGKRMAVAGPSMPVEVYGISGVPMAGDEFIVIQDERKAKEVIMYREAQKSKDTTRRTIVSLDELFNRIQEGKIKELNIILKADVQGSLEALSESLTKQSTQEVKLKVIHSSTGGITETDVMLASASGAIIIGFNVRPNTRAIEIAEKENVDIRYYDVIYNAIQDVRNAMAGLLEPVYKENVIGRANIKEVFHIPKVGTVAGCQVTDGHVERNANARLLRDHVVVFDGRISSLRRFKDDVKEVQTGYECGIGLENFQDIKPGDVFEVYKVETVKAEL
ncbi:MAG: translation initiation factor IF-2 [Desulfobacteraceae bacterium]|nr:MAG: translation initiation factor IF-2 [Desulfobacteraceae bacterium]